jgi:hypothetical protein
VNAIVLSFVRTDEGNTGMWRGVQLKSPVASPPSASNPFPPSANAPQSLTTHPTHSHPFRRFPAATMQPAALQCDRHETDKRQGVVSVISLDTRLYRIPVAFCSCRSVITLVRLCAGIQQVCVVWQMCVYFVSFRPTRHTA